MLYITHIVTEMRAKLKYLIFENIRCNENISYDNRAGQNAEALSKAIYDFIISFLANYINSKRNINRGYTCQCFSR